MDADEHEHEATTLACNEKTLDEKKANHEEKDMALEEEYEEWLNKPKEEYTKMLDMYTLSADP